MASKLRVMAFNYPCSKCRNDVDIGALSLEARKKRKRNLYCPHCGKRIGQLN